MSSDPHDAPSCVAIVSAEVAPWFSSGRLGESTQTLPKRLARHQIRSFTVAPFLQCHGEYAAEFETVCEEVSINFAGERQVFSILRALNPEDDTQVFFIRAPEFLEAGDDPYGQDRGDSGLGNLRWLFFAVAFRPALRALELSPGLLFLQDWPTALIAVLDRTDHHFDDDAHACAVIFSVHDPRQQGWHNPTDWREAKLREDLLADDLLYEGEDLNLLKGGLLFSDLVLFGPDTSLKSLFSPQSEYGLSSMYESRSEHLRAIPGSSGTPQDKIALKDAIDLALRLRSQRSREDLLLRRLDLEPSEAFLAPQRGVPEYYPIDALFLRVVDPRRLAVFWEVQGEAGRQVLDSLSADEVYGSRWELRLEALESGSRWTVTVRGLTKNWFVEVDPGRQYRAELWMSYGSSDDERALRMATSNLVSTPPDLIARSS
ncbi:MAG: glycogen/starch synthase [Planctomycetota bacterium]